MKTKVLSLFDGGVGSEWSVLGTAVDDYSVFDYSDRSIKVTSSNGVASRIDKVCSIDASEYSHIFLQSVIDDVDSMQNCIITFSNNNFASYFFINNMMNVVSGKNQYLVHKSQFSAYGTPSWANIDKMRITLTARPGMMVGASFDLLALQDGRVSGGAVIFTFDDNFISQYTEARRILDKYMYSATAFITTSTVGQPGRCSIDNLKNMRSHGWEVAFHSVNHPDFTTLTQTDHRKQIETGVAWMNANGLRPSRSHAYPFGKYNDSVVDISSEYFDIVRSTWNQNKLSALEPLNRYSVNVTSLINTTSLALAKQVVDLARENNAVAVFIGHALVDAYSGGTQEFLTEYFDELVSYIYSTGVQVKNFSWLGGGNGI